MKQLGTCLFIFASAHLVDQKSVCQSYFFSAIAGEAGVGTSDGTNLEARFKYPQGIAIDSSNRLYVADTYNDTIRKIELTGTNWVTSTISGSPGISGRT